jgi:Transglycosylase SLT domain
VTTYTYSQMQTLWLDTAKGTQYATTGWAHLMAAIAMAESSGEESVINSIGACGLWQIHPYENGCTTASTNATMALGKLQSQGLDAWETYTNGSYKQFLSGVSASDLPTSPGQGSVSAAGIGIPGLGGITGSISTIATAFKDIDTILTDILNPAFWLRIASFFAGVFFIAAGLWCLVHASDNSPILPKNLPIPVPI